MEKTLQESIKSALGMLTIVLILVSVFIIVQIVSGFKKQGDFDTITVDASAETFATPDIAEISFSVIKEDKELVVAQENVDAIIKNTLESLKAVGIEEKDIKTTYYNANPRYEYGKVICMQYRCDDGERALVGYEANQSISVTIRNLDNVGKVISVLGSAEVSNIYGPNFRIEDEDDLKAQVREEAIAKAKDKAKDLAKNLGVRIVGIENFSEGYGGGIYYAKTEIGMAEDMAVSSGAGNAIIPTGENKVETSVTITYRVK
jgi:uncharacterized protein YggE